MPPAGQFRRTGEDATAADGSMMAASKAKIIIVTITENFRADDENSAVAQVATNSFDQSMDSLLNSNPAVRALNGRESEISWARSSANKIVDSEPTASNSSILEANCKPRNFNPSWPRTPDSSLPI